MTGISDYGPVQVPQGAIELRVHGVSGTPPESLLKDTAVLISGTPTAGFYRHQPSRARVEPAGPGVREAYAWGGLTSGSRVTSALRLLLLPFSLVNVAGWMLPGVTDPTDGAPTRPRDTEAGAAARHALVSRLLALCLTAYFTLGSAWVATVAIGFITNRYSVPLLGTADAQARVTLVAVMALVGLWTLVSRRRAVAEPVDAATATKVARAPVAAPARHGIDVATLWEGTGVTRLLSRVHSAVALAFAAILADAARGLHSTPALIGRWSALLAIAFAVVGLVSLAVRDAAGRRLGSLVRFTALPLAMVAVIVALAAPSEAVSLVQMLKRVGETLTLGMSCLAVVVFVLVVAQVVVAPSGGPTVGKLYAPAFTVIGFGTAITAVSGLAVLITWWFSDTKTESLVAGLAQTIAIIGFVSVAVVIIVVLLRLNPTSQLASVAWFTRLRDTVTHARGAIVTGACVFAVGADAIAIMYLVRQSAVDPANTDPGGRGWASFGWFVAGAVVAAIFAARLRSWAARISVTVIGGVALTFAAWYVAAAVSASLTRGNLADYADSVLARADEWFVILAVICALLAPMGAVLAYMWRGSKDLQTRRAVGVLWDLVNFWPRQFHPWAPPPYTDTTIPELADRVAELTRTSGAETVVVSAHSQGAIIAVPALVRLTGEAGHSVGPGRISLLTYGQLIDCQYRWLFPWVFNPELFSQLDGLLEQRWVNLHRITDPLGHPVRVLGATDPTRDLTIDSGLTLTLGATAKPKTLNHGDYWYSAEVYQSAIDRLTQD